MTAPPAGYDFSLWYCPEDDAVADTVATLLRGHGFRGYVEHQDSVAGEPVLAAAGEVIQASRTAMLLLSPRWLADPCCRHMAEMALAHAVRGEGTRVIPVYVGLRPEQAPPALRHLTGLEFEDRFFEHRLLRSLQKAGPHTRSPGPSGVARRRGRVGFERT